MCLLISPVKYRTREINFDKTLNPVMPERKISCQYVALLMRLLR
ncbi:Uncharacterised protein [Yersinia pseudotuberculosis]|uniref:Uncharacterized protein n=1 Tax=Yersinia pseudotuberculosis TaxID=633 RepID=A0A380QDQ3_YERPU|nr:Uncharacterised protein [Yersinia pseudotuberculosis]SUP85854.1 Uncharacterised protein [Yersinia pseudotuberculosis]